MIDCQQTKKESVRLQAINYRELEKYRTYPQQWTCDRRYSTEKSITLRGSDQQIGTVYKQMDDIGRVWWIANGIKFNLLTLAGDYIYTQFRKQQLLNNNEV